MADKEDNDFRASFSGSESETGENSGNAKVDNAIPSIPPIEHQENGEDNTEAIELFLEQVAAATSAAATSATKGSKTKMSSYKKAKEREKELKRARRLVVPPECQCHLNNGQPCHTRFSVGELMDTRMHYLDISKKELDIAVLAKLECGIHLTKMTTRKKRKPTERKKHRTDFFHRGYRVCNTMFVYIHGFSYKKLKALITQYKTNGVRTRIHKNLKPRPADEDGTKDKRKKKGLLKAKLQSKDTKPRKPRIKKSKEDQAKDKSYKKDANQLQPFQNTPVTIPQNAHSTAPPPGQHLHQYPVPFPIASQNSHPQAAAFMPPPHNNSLAFPHAVGYNPINNVPVFSQPMPGPSTHPQSHPAVSNHNGNPPLDYSSQRSLANPPLDFTSQRNNSPNYQGSSRPAVTYSVVHSVTF